MDPHMEEYYIKAISNDNNKFFMIDYSITRDLLQLVDGIVSPRSTVLLEGAILGKLPFVVFPENDLNVVFSKENIHFETFCNLNSVITCFAWSEFNKYIKIFNSNLNKPNIKKQLITDINYIVETKGFSYGERLNLLVESIL
jgi:hypothetical protein